RWTQPSHRVLPAAVMAQIVPIPQVKAPAGVAARGGLYREALGEVRSVPAGDVSREAGTAGLRGVAAARAARVIVWLEPSIAVRTTWEIFTRYWDDFWYPESVDVEVFSPSGEWLLLYHHWQAFEWGRRREAGSAG